ncbi:DEAD/DEAH box helicase [Vibrio fluvialis]|uniref:DEAD/DEAH box helicase n=1 Tax=Vibrio fluvialis TaxID=676 RepID=UPI0012AE2A48|nr:DEAD/DEAH box helicase [Vibrio fluvialis]
MKYQLPTDHGLSQNLIDLLVHKSDSSYSLTDIQYEALEAGIAKGQSMLVVSPTSTGKTQIAIWGLSKGLMEGCNTVYLVTHRALAKQKFDDFKVEMLSTVLDGDSSSLVLATGDSVEDSNGELPTDPLRSRVLVATYEKYLAMLSASGIPKDMTNTVIVCDEIQLIGDLHRGQNVELLLTLLKEAGWKQLIGLSAVLQSNDSEMLANWLGVKLITQSAREKHLSYELWSSSTISQSQTSNPDNIIHGTPLPKGVDNNVLSVVAHLLKQPKPPVPIIVFCMKKSDTYDLAKEFVDKYLCPKETQMSFAFDELPETGANQFLSGIIEHRIGSHSADLTDEERQIVEKRLLAGKLDVIFATSTLGAGVNFPFGSAVFSEWKRWDSDRRDYIPIDASEFHNMSGRVGRMGFEHDLGRVIFFAKSNYENTSAQEYLRLDALPKLQSRVYPDIFEQIILQLVASGLCESVKSVINIISNTLSGLREQDRNLTSFNLWSDKIRDSLHLLVEMGLIIETTSGGLVTTNLGKAVAFSGLQPQTGVELLKYCIDKIDPLVDSLLDDSKFAYLIFNACLSSCEFVNKNGRKKTRYLPYPLSNYLLFDPSSFTNFLLEPTWQANYAPTNGAKLALDWISGKEIRDIELSMANLTAGMLREMFRNLIWVMEGLSTIIMSTVDKRIPFSSYPIFLELNDNNINNLKKLPRVIRRLSFRLNLGLPDDVLWMSSLSKLGSPQHYTLNRTEILALRNLGANSPEQLSLGTPELDNIRLTAFSKAKPTPHPKANWLRETCRTWKIQQRQRTAEKHKKKAEQLHLETLFENYYSSLGDDFEAAFENMLKALNISYVKVDEKSKIGAPDYLLCLENSPNLVVELKSKQGNNLVDYNKASEVLTASEVHGYKDLFCVTLCHPGVDPSVAPLIINCGRLSVVESHDLGEALMRIATKSLTQEQLWQWLATPGQALMDDLPYTIN